MSADTKKALDTSIRINRETRDMLEKLGMKGDTYDDVIRRLIDHFKGAGKAK